MSIFKNRKKRSANKAADEYESLYFYDVEDNKTYVKKIDHKVFGICPRCGASGGINGNSMGWSSYMGEHYICSVCGYAITSDTYNNWLSGDVIWDQEDWSDIFPVVHDDYGQEMRCENCGAYLTFQDGSYRCPVCKKQLSRKEYFNYIQAEPPGPECITCDQSYPQCDHCPHGYPVMW